MTRLERTLRGRNALINVFELWVALAAVLGATWFFFDPDSLQRTAVSTEVGHHLAEAWNVVYFGSGWAVLYGLLSPSPRVEVAGLSILGSATAVNGVAILSVFGGRGFATAMTLLTLTAAAWVRAGLVYRAARKLTEDLDAAGR